MALSCTVLRSATGKLFFLPLSHSAPSLPRFPLEFHAEINREETTVMGLSHDRSLSRFDTVPACDRQIDRQTDGSTIANTALCIASYADAL